MVKSKRIDLFFSSGRLVMKMKKVHLCYCWWWTLCYPFIYIIVIFFGFYYYECLFWM